MSARAAALGRRLAPSAPRLGLARRKTKKLIKRGKARRIAPAYLAISIAIGAIVAGVLLEQVVLAQSAFKLSAINERLQAAEARQEELLAEVAELESPGRIERYARTRLGMVDPVNVEYVVADVRIGGDNKLAQAIQAREIVEPSSATAIGSP
ncbi:MAG TPA: septum formation initiator family protein [Actinomycetota bacterium]|nr:septum formation initiator family protein [Actinomycetota bacterium]